MLLRRTLFALALFFGAIAFVHAVLFVALPEQYEYGEGAVIELAALSARGEPLYRDPAQPPWVFCPYPPLYLWVAGLLGPGFWGGRLLSALSALVLLATVATALGRRFGGTAACAFLALMLADPVFLWWSVLYRVDLLGLAFTAGGLLLAWQGRLAWAAGLFVAALLTKHSLVAAPAAVFVATLAADRRGAARFALLYASLAGAAVALLSWSSDGHFWAMITRYTAMPWITSQLVEYARTWGPTHLPLLLLAAWAARQPELRLWAIYAALALLVTVGTGRYGAFYNYFLEAQLAGAALAGAFLALRPKALPLLLFALQVLWLGPTATYYYLYAPYEVLRYETLPALSGQSVGYLEGAVADGRARRQALATLPDPALAENLGHLVVLGRLPWLCDPSSFHGLSGRGLWDEGPLLEAIADRRFGVILLQRVEGNIRFTPRVVGTILAHYRRVGEVGGEHLFVPQDP